MSHPFRKLGRVVHQSHNFAFAVYLAAGILFAVAIALTGLGHGANAETPGMSAKAKHGETIFKTQCIGCHNKEAGDTAPFGPPNLHGILGSKPLITPQQAVDTIKTGKGIMPAFAGKLNPTEINDVVAYLKTQ